MCKCNRYHGLLIYENISPKFGSTYFTVVNDNILLKDGRSPHVHANSYNICKNIVDCFNQLKTKSYAPKFDRYIRNKSMRLFNLNVKCL